MTVSLPWTYRLRVSARARYYRINILSNSQVEVVYPKRGSAKQAMAFLEEKRPWIERHLATAPSTAADRISGKWTFPCLNQEWQIKSEAQPGTRLARVREVSPDTGAADVAEARGHERVEAGGE